MSTYPSIPATVELRRGRFFGLVVGIAALTAAVTWALSAYAFDSGSATTASSASQVSEIVDPLPPASLHFRVVAGPGSATSAAQDARRVTPIMSLSAADLAANALGTGYAVPSAHEGPSVESVLASMSPRTREYTKRIMSLTFAQLAAGAAGQP